MIKRIINTEIKKCNLVPESTDNTWMRIRDTLKETDIDIILNKPYKTKIIEQAKIKSNKLVPHVLSGLLVKGSLYKSYWSYL